MPQPVLFGRIIGASNSGNNFDIETFNNNELSIVVEGYLSQEQFDAISNKTVRIFVTADLSSNAFIEVDTFELTKNGINTTMGSKYYSKENLTTTYATLNPAQYPYVRVFVPGFGQNVSTPVFTWCLR